MHMKRTQLEKVKGKQIVNAMRGAATPGRYAHGSAAPVSRKAQRRQEQALGLTPFAVKLPSALVRRLQARAHETGADLGRVTAELLEAALDAAPPAPSTAEEIR